MDISTRGALREMIVPGLLAVVVPIAVGVIPGLGKEAVGGLLIGAIAAGALLAITMANSGGAWDNAKKYIEAGAHGGKGTDEHAAAVVGDTVGDPFKDTSGPSLNILSSSCPSSPSCSARCSPGRRAMDLGITGKRALVTGGTRGIGYAIAWELAREGADVALCARDESAARDVAAEIAAGTGVRVVGFRADTGVAEDVMAPSRIRRTRTAGWTSS